MDPLRFDSLSRELTRSRRGALAAVVGGTLGLLGLAETTAKRKKGKGKKKPKQCKPACDVCKIQTCAKGHCGCAPGQTEQGGVCGYGDVECKSVLQICTSHAECCSFRCDLPDDSGALRCNFSDAFCKIDFDCLDGGPCRGFMCPRLYRDKTGCS
jgi:hypothetical protein